MSDGKRLVLGKGYNADGSERICIPLEYFGVKVQDCDLCGIKQVCWQTISQEALDIIVEHLRRHQHLREFWEDYEEELYD